MRKLIMCVGLPASGKTTWAKEQVELFDCVRVSKDDIRAELTAGGWQWSHKNEKDVIRIRDQRIIDALQSGKSVISDDTNLATKHQLRLRQLATENKAWFGVKRFDTPIEECIRRDTARNTPVGEAVIRSMAEQFNLIQPEFAVYVPDTKLPAIILCDLDGTLAINDGHRSFYDASTADKDKLNQAVFECIDGMWLSGIPIRYLSGREEKYREPTIKFLIDNACPGFASGPPTYGDLLLMRTTGDKRTDWIVKGELFDKHIRPFYNVLFALDDRNQVVDFWRRIGVPCFQVAPGDF